MVLKHGSTLRQKARGKMSKICPECGSSDVYVEVLYPYHSMNLACCRACGHLGEEPEFIITTVFETITASPEVLAEKLVYKTICVAVNRVTYSCWKSTITDESYRTKEEAIAATVAKLKEVCDEN